MFTYTDLLLDITMNVKKYIYFQQFDINYDVTFNNVLDNVIFSTIIQLS